MPVLRNNNETGVGYGRRHFPCGGRWGQLVLLPHQDEGGYGNYDGLRNYMLGVVGRSPRTFNTYVKRLRSFLFWTKSQELPVPTVMHKSLASSKSC